MDQETRYERLRHGDDEGNKKQSGCFQQHKTLAAVLLAIFLTMVITAGIIVVVMVAITKDRTESDAITKAPVTMENNIADITTSSIISSTASLVVIGGWQRSDTLNTVDIYQLNSGNIRWSHQGHPSPYTWRDAGRAVGRGNIYLLGGHTHINGLSTRHFGVAQYSITDNTWNKLPNFAWDTASPTIFIHHDTLYATAVGGTNWALKLLEVNSMALTWTEEDIKLPYSVSNPNVVVSVGDRVFIVSRTNGYFRSLISWRPGSDEPWRSLSDMNIARYPPYLCTVSDGVDRIWVMGGCDNCTHHGFMEMYQISTDRWTIIDAVPEYKDSHFIHYAQNRAHICGYHDGYIYATLGEQVYHTPDHHFHIYNTMENSWTISETELKTKAGNQAAVVTTTPYTAYPISP